MGDGGGGDGDDGRIFPEHPSPILHAPRDLISRKGKSFTPISLYISEIGGSEFAFRQAPPDLEFCRVVCACARSGCLVTSRVKLSIPWIHTSLENRKSGLVVVCKRVH